VSAALLLGILALAGVVVLLLWLGRELLSLNIQAAAAKAGNEAMAQNLQALSEALARRIESFEKTMDERIDRNQSLLGQSLGTMQQHSAESARLIKDVGENLGKIFQASQKIEALAGEVTRLEDLLKPPKLRGTLGETFLEETLRQCLPPGSFEMQMRFSDGEIVDAAIRLRDTIVPVDSKFPLENYRRSLEAPDESDRKRARRQFTADVKKHADAIAQKYIRVAEGTLDFALMYIPAEAVYAEIAADGEEGSLADYARAQHVFPVSPANFYLYLATIGYGLRRLEIEKRAHEIVEDLSRLKRGIEKVEDPLGKLGSHLSNAQKQYEETAKQLARFSEQVRRVGEADEKLVEEDPTSLRALPPA
jgi:DNA recombination protein RmuC